MADAKTTPAFTSEKALSRLRESVHSKAANFYAMYSSVLGGIVTDPALMVLPLDDHMVHRGHAVFDTATLTHGMLYQLDPHLDRLILSATGARIALPFPREHLRQIILETAAASHQRDASVRYWLSAGPGGYGLGPAECVGSSFLPRRHQAHQQPGADQATPVRAHQVNQLLAQRARPFGSQRSGRRQRRIHRPARYGGGEFEYECCVRHP
jgi:hypothetical protein